MRIFHLALKDLRQIVQQKKSALFLLLMPLLFTGLMGIVFDRNEKADPRLPVALVVSDGGVLGEYLQTLLDYSDTILPMVPDQKDTASLEQLIRSQKIAAAVVIPAGFSEQTLAGESPRLTLFVDRNTPAGQAADRAVQLAATRLLGAVEAARLSVEIHAPFDDDETQRAYLLESLARAVRAWASPRVTVSLEASGLPYAGRSGFAQASSGMLVFFATIGMITPGYILLAERRSRTLARMLTTSLRRAEIIAGHTLAMFTVGFLQVVLLALFGRIALGLDYWHDPAATLLLAGALAFWSAAFGLLISALARDEHQVILSVMGGTLFLGLMGGAFFPLELTGESFAAIGHWLPSAWAIEGFQDIILRGANIHSILLPAGILILYALGAYGCAVWRLRFDDGM